MSLLESMCPSDDRATAGETEIIREVRGQIPLGDETSKFRIHARYRKGEDVIIYVRVWSKDFKIWMTAVSYCYPLTECTLLLRNHREPPQEMYHYVRTYDKTFSVALHCKDMESHQTFIFPDSTNRDVTHTPYQDARIC